MTYYFTDKKQDHLKVVLSAYPRKAVLDMLGSSGNYKLAALLALVIYNGGSFFREECSH